LKKPAAFLVLCNSLNARAQEAGQGVRRLMARAGAAEFRKIGCPLPQVRVSQNNTENECVKNQKQICFVSWETGVVAGGTVPECCELSEPHFRTLFLRGLGGSAADAAFAAAQSNKALFNTTIHFPATLAGFVLWNSSVHV
jgi:hypothetical protein